MIESTIHVRINKKEHHITIFSKVSDVSFSRYTMKIFVVHMDQKKMSIAVIELTHGSKKD